MTEQEPEIFIYNGGSVNNACTNCRVNSTSGSWRKGWVVAGGHVNLCNRCGQRFQKGLPFHNEADTGLHPTTTGTIIIPPPPPLPMVTKKQQQAPGKRAKRRTKADQPSSTARPSTVYADDTNRQIEQHEDDEDAPIMHHQPRGGNGKYKRLHSYNLTRRGAAQNIDDDDDDDDDDEEEEDQTIDNYYYSIPLGKISQQDKTNLLFTAKRLAVSASRQQGMIPPHNNDNASQHHHREPSPALIDTRPVHFHPTNSQLGIYADMEQKRALRKDTTAATNDNQNSKSTLAAGAAVAEKKDVASTDDGTNVDGKVSLEHGDSDQLLVETPYFPGIPIQKSTILADQQQRQQLVKDGSGGEDEDNVDIAALLQQPELPNSTNILKRTQLLHHQISISPAPSPLHIPLDNNTSVGNEHDDDDDDVDGNDEYATHAHSTAVNVPAGCTLPPHPLPVHVSSPYSGIVTTSGTATAAVGAVPIPLVTSPDHIPLRHVPSPHHHHHQQLPHPHPIPSPAHTVPNVTITTTTPMSSNTFLSLETMCTHYATILQESHISEHAPLSSVVINQSTAVGTPNNPPPSSPSPGSISPNPGETTKTKWLSVKEAIQMVEILGSIDIPLLLLEQTHISAAVAKLMAHPNLELASEARILADRWRSMAINALQAAQNIPS